MYQPTGWKGSSTVAGRSFDDGVQMTTLHCDERGSKGKMSMSILTRRGFSSDDVDVRKCVVVNSHCCR